MKLKNKILTALCVVSATAMVACNDDYLEKYPQTTLTEENAFQTSDNFKAYMYNSYDLFTNANIYTNHSGGSYYWGGQWSSEFWSGVMTCRDRSTNAYAFQTMTPATSGNGWNFTPVRRVNIMLSHIDDSAMSEADKEHWRSVGYFFQAWWYMDLVDKFGDVPWIDKALNDQSPEAYMARTPRAEVVQHIIDYLEYAIAHIGVESNKDTGNYGDNTVTADAARAALCRFLLREGTWAKYHGLDEPYETYLNKCLEVAEPLMARYTPMTAGLYNKYPGAAYDEEFTSESLEGNTGVIMYKQYVTGILQHRFSDLIHVEAHRADAPQHTVDMFLMKNGLPINNPNSGFKGGKGHDLWDYYADRDPRLHVNFEPPCQANAVNNANPDNETTFKKWTFWKAGEKLNGGNHVITEAEVEKFRTYIDYFGPNVFCENGTGDQTLGSKRLPGHNWGGSMCHSAPNLSERSQTDNYMRCWSGYYFWKHFTMWEVGSNDYYQTSDKPIFTIEEVLLNYAEAAFELNRFNQGVADRTINLLRRRSDVADMKVAEINDAFDPDRDNGNVPWVKGYDAKTTYAVDPVLWEIRRERMVELMGQGFAFYDIRRWHKAPYYVNRQTCGMWVDKDNFPYGNGTFSGSLVDYDEIKRVGYAMADPDARTGWIYHSENGGGGVGPLYTGKGWKDTYYLRQIPTDEIAMNPNLTQNPGWDEEF